MGEQGMSGSEMRPATTQENILPNRNKGFLRSISRRIMPVGLALALGLSGSSPAIQQPRPEMSPTLPNTELIPLATGTPHSEEIPLAQPPAQDTGREIIERIPNSKAELIPLAKPGDDKAELIPLAKPTNIDSIQQS